MNSEHPATEKANQIIYDEIAGQVEKGDLINASLKFSLNYAELHFDYIDVLTEKLVTKAIESGTDNDLALARTAIQARYLLGIAQKQNETIIGQRVLNPAEIK